MSGELVFMRIILGLAFVSLGAGVAVLIALAVSALSWWMLLAFPFAGLCYGLGAYFERRLGL